MERWKNLQAFWAQQSSSPFTDHWQETIVALRNALGPSEQGEQAGNREFLLQTACICLICGMEWIWPRVQEGSEHWQREKWEWWKQSLENARCYNIEEETRALISEALSAMEKAQKGQDL